MKRSIAKLVLMSLLAAGAAPAPAAVRDLNTVKEGNTIPAFKGRLVSGEEIDVGALIGKRVLVLAFWSIYCKPCVEEISSLIRLQEQLGGDKLEVIGINADTEVGLPRVRTFMARFEEFEKRKINYPVIFDENSAISKLLGVGFLPTVLSVNLKGQVEKIFMGFEEKSEPEIFAGIRRLLPLEGEGAGEPEEATVFAVEAVAPLCGFYNSEGWKGSFEQNYDLSRELERIAEVARRKALKLALREALAAAGVSLLQSAQGEGCFTPLGVALPDDPFTIPDNLTNLLAALPADRLAKVLESQEDFIAGEFHVVQRVAVNLQDLKGELEKLKVQLTPRTVTFSVVNLRRMDQSRFEQALLRQSRYIGFANFPTYTIYTTTETFADEVKHMDFGGVKLFVEEAEGDRIEVEAWK
ncbi:MAG TPA: TlpA disulfide reductase family protein [Candidatus Methanoperedens sp.]|nr:TlpA disulfide reductase family protein [Candidatus Methanoperedens sp.]